MNSGENQLILRSEISAVQMSMAFKKALLNSILVHWEDTAAIFYDLTSLKERIRNLQQLFPESTLHAIAVKANPLSKILSEIRLLGVGAEVASFPELCMAEKAGFAADTMVFDSPCKTKAEIEYALKAGVYLNVDSFDELDRIGEILKTLNSKSKIGLRINPQVGSGSIKSTSVAEGISKFGVPINDHRARITEYYLKYDWLRGIHVHIGSQGCPVPLLVDGIRKVLDLAIEVNEQLKTTGNKNLIETFDIGGGLPVSYQPGINPVSMEQYTSMLRTSCSELFDGKIRLISEFGRYIYANLGWVASKVEYVKRESNYNIIMTHVGADLFLRKCYNPGDWHHHITVVDKDGNLKSGTAKNKYIVAGPLCFAGDVIAKDIELPHVKEGDYLLIHDAGAYTLSMWSRYNSRQIPKVIGYHTESDSFKILKGRESIEDLSDFWS